LTPGLFQITDICQVTPPAEDNSKDSSADDVSNGGTKTSDDFVRHVYSILKV
jgi:hypothetical protein